MSELSVPRIPVCSPLDKASPVPLYHQLRKAIEGQIQRGEFRPNDRLPAEDELAVGYEVSKITVREALKLLAAAGKVRRERGRGTFVNAPRLTKGPRKLTCFTGEMQMTGLQASSRVIEAGIVASDADVAAQLGVATGANVFRLRRVRLANDEVMGIQTAYLPAMIVPGIEALDFADSSLYEVLERRYGLKPAQARETHFAVGLEPGDARHLGLAPGTPALAAERLTLMADGRPLEFVLSVMRGDRYKIVLNLTEL
jgi:GntR family transcriptional regulator